MKDKNNSNRIVCLLFFLIFFFFLILFSKIFSYNDFTNIIKWYLMLLLMTIAGLPASLYFFDIFYDKGYIFSKVIGIIFTGYIVWFLSSLQIIKFNLLNIYICTICVIIVSYILLILKNLKNKKIFYKIKPTLFVFLRIEIVFFLLFLFICYIKGFNPNANSTEKFMDFGYMAIISKTDYMPPMDLWFSGKSINYYYFGQYISSFMSKLACVKINYGYNLMLITLFSLTFLESFSISYNLLFKSINKKVNKYLLFFGGLIAALSNTIAGNMHYVIYKIILPMFKGDTTYFFSDSTRYIGYNPDTIDKTIHEFPSYSFILGDLHAHVINIIFVLLIIALLLSYVVKIKKTKKIVCPITIFISILLGIFKMTNYWDFIIYIVVVVLIFLFFNIVKYMKFRKIFLITLVQIAIIIVFSTLVSIPFMINFNKMVMGVKFVPYRTPIYQLFVLWGLPVLLTMYYIIYCLKKIKISKKKNILEYINKMEKMDLFMIILAFCAIGLILIPEVVYVVDIYLGSVRANTMFKLTYQSYILFSIGFGYFIVKLLLSSKKCNRLVSCGFLFFFVLTLGFSITASKSWFGDLSNTKNYKSLNAMSFLKDDLVANSMPDYMNDSIDHSVNMSDDLAMINWINNNIDNDSIIIEATGESYSFYNRISTFTGLATPMGWQTHEWLWRIDDEMPDIPREVQKRIKDVDTFYTTNNKKLLEKIILKYNLSYIIIGYNERIKYSKENNILPNEQELKSLGDVVYETNKNKLNNPMYIIKIKKKKNVSK